MAAHRALFRRGRERELVTSGHRAASAGVGGLALTLASAPLLVLDLTAGRVTAVFSVLVSMLVLVAIVIAPADPPDATRASQRMPGEGALRRLRDREDAVPARAP